ncbi:activating signal cointegrator 1 complex subunit 3 [Ceratobasidium sp. AG-Ba]|nr:activating signal cointegrator 1 complex subunit 3 [Ceratobasidium sp. AG-Ba]
MKRLSREINRIWEKDSSNQELGSAEPDLLRWLNEHGILQEGDSAHPSLNQPDHPEITEQSDIAPRPTPPIPEDEHTERAGSVNTMSKPRLRTRLTAEKDVVREDTNFLKGIGREAEVWSTYVKESKEFDIDMVEGWNKYVTSTWVIAALFSAILTAFVLESSKLLEPDRPEQTVALLVEISQALRASAPQQGFSALPQFESDSEFHPNEHTVWVNCLWFLSLSISISVTLAAMLAKQWCYYFLSFRKGDTITQAEERQRRFNGLEKWKMREVLEHLPMLMHIALALFSVGLILYLWDLHIAVAATVSTVTVATLCLYLATTFVPVWDYSCPYKTTQSVYVARVVRYLEPKLSIIRQKILGNRKLTHSQTSWAKLTFWETGRQRTSNRISNISSSNHPVPTANPDLSQSPLQTIILPFLQARSWALGQIKFRSPVADLEAPGSPHNRSGVQLEAEAVAEPVATSENVPAVPPSVGGASDSTWSLPLTRKPEDEPEPFVRDALEWLIRNSKVSRSIDTAIGALVIGRVNIENQSLRRKIDLHLVKHFSDCFVASEDKVIFQLSPHPRALESAMDYMNWISPLAGSKPREFVKQLLEFVESFEADLVTHLGLSIASLAKQEKLQSEAGRNAALWLASFVRCYSEDKIFLAEDVLSVLVHGLAAAGRYIKINDTEDLLIPNVQKRAHVLAIPQLVNILWKVSHITNSVLRYSITVNLAAFALTSNLPYPFEAHNFESGARTLVYEDTSIDDRKSSYTSLAVFALLGFMHPKSKIGLDGATLETASRIIYETNYLGRSNLIIKIPQLPELESLRRYLTSMLIESMTHTSKNLSPSRPFLLRTAFKSLDSIKHWERRTFRSVIHATNALITAHIKREITLYDDAVVATTDLLYRETINLKRLDSTVLGFDIEGNSVTETEASRLQRNSMIINREHNDLPREYLASKALALILESSDNKQCLELAPQNGLIESGYVRILTSMVLHCANPGGLSEQLQTSAAVVYEGIENIIQTLVRANDTDVQAFGVTALVTWKFACLNRRFSAAETKSDLETAWSMILKRREKRLRPETLEALIDTTSLLAAITDSVPPLSRSQAQALLQLLDRFKSEAHRQVQLALGVSVAFWGVSLDEWDFWTPERRIDIWRDYTQPNERAKNISALLLLGLSRILMHYSELKLGHSSIRTIAYEIDRHMRHHARYRSSLTLSFLRGFDVRRHVQLAQSRFVLIHNHTPPIGRIFSPQFKLALRPPRSQPRRDGSSSIMSKSDAGYIPLPAYSSRPASPASYPNSPLPGYHDQRHGRLGESYRAAVEALNADPRFSTEEPQTWQRVVLLLIMAALFYAAFHLKSASFLGMEDS